MREGVGLRQGSCLQAANIGWLTRADFLRLSGAGLGGLVLAGSTGCGVLGLGGEGDGGQQSMVAAYNRPIEDLDPHGVNSAAEQVQLPGHNVYGTLVDRDGEEITPGLAENWKQPDERTWVFTLRDNATFHDGSPVTANDAKASLERLANTEEAPLAPLWAPLDSVEATDEKTLTIRTTEPLGTMLSNLTLLFVLPAGKMEEPDFFRKPIGAGPFQVESFVASERLALSAYEDHWNGAPKLGQLELTSVEEESTRLTSLETNEVQATWPVSPDQLARLRDQSGVVLDTTPSYTYYFNWFNCSREPFTDARIRQAMWHAVDTQSIVDSLFGDSGKIMKAPIPSSVFGYAEQEPYAYDPDRARELLTEAGYGDGFSSSLMLGRGFGAQARRVAQTMISYWGEIGVEVELQEVGDATFIERLLALDWDMDLQTNATQTGDADYTLGRLYISEANRLGYTNEELDEVLVGARTTTDQGERADLYARACEIIWNDAPGIFPVEVVATYALRSGVEGFNAVPTFTPSFQNVSLEE